MKKQILLPVITIVVAAVILLAASFGLNSIAADRAQADHIRLMQTVLPGSTDFVLEDYDGEDANIRSVHKSEIGFVIETATNGYAGEITMYIGVNNDGKVTGLVVRDLSETFGLGAQALTDHEFLAQFLNSSGRFEVAVAQNDAFSGATEEVTEASDDTVTVDALTGATVTSKAIVRSVNSAVAYVTGADAASSATTWGG